MSDGIYRATESLIVAVRVAMRELENASMGAVGDNGPSLDEMDLRVARTGLPWEGNADYETMQRAWRILEAGLREYVDNMMLSDKKGAGYERKVLNNSRSMSE